MFIPLVLCLSLKIFFSINLVTLENVYSKPTLVKEINRLRPHQLTIFTRKSAGSGQNYFFNNLISKIPAVILDTHENTIQSTIARSLNNLTRKSNLLMILQDKLDPEEIKANVETFIKLTPKRIRPRLLIVCDDTFRRDNLTESILKYGWSRKFLDMTIVSLRNGEMLYFNPFSNRFNLKSTAPIFPNKLRNMRKYPLKIDYWDEVPWLFTKKIGNVTEHCGLDVDFLKLLETSFNFKMIFNHSETIDYVDLIPGRHPLTLENYYSRETGTVVTFYESCAVIADKNVFQFELSFFKLLIKVTNLIVTFSIINLIHCLLVIMKVDSDMFEYITTLLSQPRVQLPRAVIQKNLLLSLGLFSMFFFPDIIGKLTEIFIDSQEKSISTYKDILDANLQPYGSKYDLGFRDQDEHLNDLLLRVIEHDNDAGSRCLEMAVKKQNVICIVSTQKAKMFMKIYKKSNGKPLLKITDIDFPTFPEGMNHALASPYIEAFDKVTQSLFEAGIVGKITEKFIKNISVVDYDDDFEDRNSPVIYKQSLSVIFIGLTISALIFIFELCIRFIKKIKLCFI